MFHCAARITSDAKHETIFKLLDDCLYTLWSNWTRCDASCSRNGNRTRKQFLIRKGSTLSNPHCSRENVETMPCTGEPCPCIAGVNCTCELSKWSDWSKCSEKCGGGQRVRNRQFKTKATQNCTLKNFREVQPCNVNCCPVNGRFSSWTRWSLCSKKCGSGFRLRYRACNSPAPSCKGKSCSGCTISKQACNTRPCGKYTKRKCSLKVLLYVFM
jgi:hypothetical protein